ncbi:hypothetical protein [Rathayibacter tanaceti]|uniref:Uncharacterized protein n=1 Tax=Rathayibacter tanaceti TaxID=1671680 RepID=A0A166H6E7_9MICO|nr:hypothetical protein [Rathayibacter tanaceti]KZX20026.1 hypothetical protein ACH61_02870 [Rathayibacter tanaceti]
MSTNWKRWTPVAVVPAVVVAAAVALPLSATAAGDLPERSAADLLAFVAQSETTAFSGEIQQTSDLGLPDLSGLATTAPTAADASATNALVEFATGSHQARVYVDAEQGVRFQVLDRLAERDVIATPGGASGSTTRTRTPPRTSFRRTAPHPPRTPPPSRLRSTAC